MTRAPAPGPTIPARLLAGALGLFVALGLGELLATCAMGGAYPTLNLYEPDPRYGVVLTPDAHTRVVSPAGNVTAIRTNAHGFRGPQWPAPPPGAAPVPGRVLVVGDSQVMGWGVPEESTFSALLDAAGLEVIAAGVPTWGPLEYTRALGELLPRLRPSHVVYVLNAANDHREAPLPNTRRTTARDGWARVPLGPAADAFSDFPLRRFLLGRSHLVLALRLLFDPPPARALPPAHARSQLADLPRHLAPDPPFRSRLTRHVIAARALATAHGAAFIPVLVPIDIQVHPGEWAKYRLPPEDTSATRALQSALAADLPDLVDLLPALATASPGAFLPDDDHLSPRGHAVVAAELAARLPPARTPTAESRR